MKIKFLLTILLVSAVSYSFSQSGVELVKKMIAKGKEISTMKFDMAIKERVHGKLHNSKSSFKLQYSPYKVYIKQEYPLKGMEALYVYGSNNNDVYVHPNRFPWTNLNLGVNSAHMRKDQHHSLSDAGVKYVYSIIDHLMGKYNSEIDKLISNDGTIVWKKKQCWKITMKNPHFTYQQYKVQPGETAQSIALKFKINDYFIIDKNPNITELDDCKPGMNIKIPVDYASKMDIWLDKETFVPVIMKIYDDEGIYEEYEFMNVQLNYRFNPAEFASNYKDYNF